MDQVNIKGKSQKITLYEIYNEREGQEREALDQSKPFTELPILPARIRTRPNPRHNAHSTAAQDFERRQPPTLVYNKTP